MNRYRSNLDYAIGMLGNAPIGLVPLNWRYSKDSLDSYLEGIAGYGFKGIQISEEQGNDPTFNAKAKALAIRNAEHYIAIRCTPDGVIDGHLDEYLGQVEFAARQGVEMLVLAVDGSLDREKIAGRVTSNDAMSDKGFNELAKVLNQIAEAANSHNIPSSFHPHAATYIETPEETRQLLSMTDLELVKVCLDVGHWIVGGGDPLEAVRENVNRITHVHVKDVSGEVLSKMLNGGYEIMDNAVVQDKLFVPAGTGILDLSGFLSALEGIKYQGWLMSEQDSAYEPSEAASGISMANIKKVLN
jgi:inosose dehydratase